MIPDQIPHGGGSHISVNLCQMSKAFSSFCIGRYLQCIQQAVQLHGNMHGIYHSVFRISRMGYLSFYLYIGNSEVKVIIVELSQLSSVHRIGKIAVEFFQVKIQRAFSNLFIAGKADIYLSMADFRMCHQRLCHLHDYGYTALIICS